ncbi:MAG: hypothetical protein GXO09_01565 [Crenarchaeota archaeon]|nr:hypothetical protein [Thermoproteota archaeon]
MPIYLRHRSAWLRIKEVYSLQSASSGKRRRKSKTTPYGMVAECVNPPKLDSGMPSAELKVSASKVTKFITRLYRVLDADVIVLVKPRDEYHYMVKIYAPSKDKLEKALRQARAIIAELKAKKAGAK